MSPSTTMCMSPTRYGPTFLILMSCTSLTFLTLFAMFSMSNWISSHLHASMRISEDSFMTEYATVKTKKAIIIPAMESVTLMLKYLLKAMPAKAVIEVSTSLVELNASALRAGESYLLAARALKNSTTPAMIVAKSAVAIAISALIISLG